MVNAFAVNDGLRALAVRRVQEAAILIQAAKNQERAKVRIGTAIHATYSGSVHDVMESLPIDGDYHAWPDWKLWHAVGLCEQRGSGQYDSNGDGIAWHGSPAGGLPTSGYPGGLGLGVPFWNEFHAAAGVAQTNGAYASPGEQIRVARAGSHNGTRMGGWSSWGSGCVQRTMAAL